MGEATKSLENNDFSKGFCRFCCFQTLLEKVGRFLHNSTNSTEPQARGEG